MGSFRYCLHCREPFLRSRRVSFDGLLAGPSLLAEPEAMGKVHHPHRPRDRPTGEGGEPDTLNCELSPQAVGCQAFQSCHLGCRSPGRTNRRWGITLATTYGHRQLSSSSGCCGMSATIRQMDLRFTYGVRALPNDASHPVERLLTFSSALLSPLTSLLSRVAREVSREMGDRRVAEGQSW